MCGFGKKKPGYCSCCKVPILISSTEHYRRVHFALNDGTVTFASFCAECSQHDWTPERVAALDWQTQDGWHAQICFRKLSADVSAPHECKYHENFHSLFKILGHSPEYPVQTWEDLMSEVA